MLVLFGKSITRADLERRVGAMSQIAFVRPITLDDGRSRGTRAFQISTGGGLDLTVVADRALDIHDFRHNGRSLCWHSGVSPSAPTFYEAESDNWLRSFFGGMLTTCGLSNAGSPSEENGVQYGLHGRISNSPAENVSWGAEWQGDDYVLWVAGEVRETRVFGPRFVLKRRITTSLLKPTE